LEQYWLERGLSRETENLYDYLAQADVADVDASFGCNADLLRLQQGIGQWRGKWQRRGRGRHHQSRRIRIVNRQGGHVRPDVASRNAVGRRRSQRGGRSAREKD